MAVYRLTVEKFMPTQNEYWTNVYHVNADPGADSVPVSNALVAAEKQLLYTDMIITKVSVSIPGSGSGAVLGANVYNEAGVLIANVERFPLFVVARVDFTVASSRPSRKYLRGALAEPDVNFMTIVAPVLTRLQTYANAIAAIAGICDIDGQPIVNGAPKSAPTNRQLRRGSKKKVTP